MFERISKILREYKEDDTLQITADTTFESLELDSLDMAELIMKIDDELNVEIEMDEALKTVGDLLKVIEK